MRPNPALLLVACGALLGALAVAPVPAAAAAAAGGSRLSGGLGAGDQQLDRPDGDRRRSGSGTTTRTGASGTTPDGTARSTRSSASAPSAQRRDAARGLGSEVHVAAVDLGGRWRASWSCSRSNALFVDANPDAGGLDGVAQPPGSRSTRRRSADPAGSRFNGELTLDAAPSDGQSVVTTRDVQARLPGPSRLLPTAPPARHHQRRRATVCSGSFGARLRVTDGYHVVVAGWGDAGDPGWPTARSSRTTAPVSRSARAPRRRSLRRWSFLNNGGWYAGADPFSLDEPPESRSTSAIVAKADGRRHQLDRGTGERHRRGRAPTCRDRPARRSRASTPSAITTSVGGHVVLHRELRPGSRRPTAARPRATEDDTQIAVGVAAAEGRTPES